MASDETVLEVLDLFSMTYGKPGQKAEPTDQQVGIYTAALADLDDDELRQAAMECVKSAIWFPRIAEVRAAVDQIHQRNLHNPDPGKLYWQAMSLLSANLRGLISDEQLEREPVWRWYQRNKPPEVDNPELDRLTPDELAELAERRLAEVGLGKYAEICLAEVGAEIMMMEVV